MLQELINVLPVSANIPSAVDVELQTRVARLFQVHTGHICDGLSLDGSRSCLEGWSHPPTHSPTHSLTHSLTHPPTHRAVLLH